MSFMFVLPYVSILQLFSFNMNSQWGFKTLLNSFSWQLELFPFSLHISQCENNVRLWVKYLKRYWISNVHLSMELLKGEI